MNGPASPYYPPRARWNRGLYYFGYACRRALLLDRIQLPLTTTFSRFLVSLILPGFSFFDSGWKIVGRTVMGLWGLAASVFLAWLGYFAGNAAFGLMISLHVSSVLYLLHRMYPGLPPARRLLLSLGVLLVVSQLFYVTSLNWIQNHWFMPFRMGDRVYVVRHVAPIGLVKRGDMVACRTEGMGGQVRIHDGYLLDRIIAVPGDEVVFEPGEFLINGDRYPSLPLMPISGRVVLKEKTWLIWPSLRKITRNNVSDETIAASVLQLAMVSRDQIIGKPFRYWFWRKQTS